MPFLQLLYLIGCVNLLFPWSDSSLSSWLLHINKSVFCSYFPVPDNGPDCLVIIWMLPLFFLCLVTSKMVIKLNQDDLVNIHLKLIILIFFFSLHSARYIVRSGMQSYSYLYVWCQEALYIAGPGDIFARWLNWNEPFP